MSKGSGEIRDPCGVPTLIRDGRLGEPWKATVHDLYDRTKETRSTMYVSVCLARREALRVEALTLSKPALMSRKRVEALSLGL